MNQKTMKRKLFDKLRDFHNDKDFVVGVISDLETDDEMQTVIDYIDNGEDVSVENIMLLSLHIDKNRVE